MNNLKDRLNKIIYNTFCEKIYDDADIKFTDFINDFNMDSFIFILLVVNIEAEYHIIVPDNLLIMENFRNYDNVVMVIQQLIGDKYE